MPSTAHSAWMRCWAATRPPPDDAVAVSDESTGERIDKWLWAARFYKTRPLATHAVNGGKVHLDGARIKAGRRVRAGARLTIHKDELTWQITVLAVTGKRGPASVAASLYEESESSVLGRQQAIERRRENAMAPIGPTTRPGSKRDRRALGRLKRGD